MTTTRNRRRPPLPPPPAGSRPFEAVVDGWRSMPAALVVLRLFLGVTFVYAGAQKLLDPNFLRSGSPDFIGTQLRGFAQGSPIGWLLDPLAHVAVLAGLGIAITELAIGIGTLAGIAPRTMAVGGFLVNLALLLSATWHVHPYFLGSDSVYAVAWAAYLVGYLEHARRSNATGAAARVRSRHASDSAIDRRELLRGATLAGATIAAAAAAKLLSGTPAAATLAATGAGAPLATTTGTGSPSPSGDAATTTTGGGAGGGGTGGGGAQAVSGTPVVELSKVPVGGAIGFQAPGGTPAALVRLSNNDVVAYSRVCTHAGCLVGYDPNQQVLYCPCHGAEYDPARGAAVIGGPAPRPLAEIPVKIDRATGEVVIPN